MMVSISFYTNYHKCPRIFHKFMIHSWPFVVIRVKTKPNAIQQNFHESFRLCSSQKGESKSLSSGCLVSFSDRIAFSAGICQSMPRLSSNIEIPPSASG